MRLSCTDGTSGTAPSGNIDATIGGVTIQGVFGNVHGTRTDEFKMGVPKGDTLYIVKAPTWLKAGATATIGLSAASDGYLAWVPAGIWTSSTGGVDLTPWLASKVIMDGCADRDVTYLGGLLSTNPNICLTLHVADATGEAQDVRVGSTANCG